MYPPGDLCREIAGDNAAQQMPDNLAPFPGIHVLHEPQDNHAAVPGGGTGGLPGGILQHELVLPLSDSQLMARLIVAMCEGSFEFRLGGDLPDYPLFELGALPS
jgi:hypothetical protein